MRKEAVVHINGQEVLITLTRTGKVSMAQAQLGAVRDVLEKEACISEYDYLYETYAGMSTRERNFLLAVSLDHAVMADGRTAREHGQEAFVLFMTGDGTQDDELKAIMEYPNMPPVQQQTNTNTMEELPMTNTQVIELEAVLEKAKGHVAEVDAPTITGNTVVAMTKAYAIRTWDAIKGAVAKVKAYDYKSLITRSTSKLSDLYTWTNTSKAGRFTKGTTKVGMAALVAGTVISFGSILANAVTVSITAGALLAIYNLARDKRQLSNKETLTVVGKAMAISSAFVLGAWFVAPLVFTATAYAANLALFAIAHSFVVVFA